MIESRPQALINLLLFWWIALLLPLVRQVGVTGTTVATLAASILVESLQWVLPTGRSTAVMDVLLNTTGGLVMAIVGVHMLRPMLSRLTQVAFPVALRIRTQEA